MRNFAFLNFTMEALLKKSIENSYSYAQYRELVATLLFSGKSTGHEQSADLLRYTQLNHARTNRLDKTLRVDEAVSRKLLALKRNYIWLVIAEGWCGDAAQIVPIFHKMAVVTDKIDLKIVLRDDNPQLMDQFLTNGSRSIPILIIIDADTFEVVGHFGPRPTQAKQLIVDYKAQHGVVDETAKTALQKWYFDDKGLSTQREVMALLP